MYAHYTILFPDFQILFQNIPKGRMKMEEYKNDARSFEERALDLISRMTLEEKISQLSFDAPAIPRLGIRAWTWWNEASHGVSLL